MERSECVAAEVLDLLTETGGEQYFGEAVTKLEHALQCAWHAMQAGAGEELIFAALLHDIGHDLDDEDTIRDERVGVVNHHETGRRWPRERGFSERIATLVGGHVDAKRYQTAANGAYFARLSPASIETPRLQGGPMEAEEALLFAAHPWHREMLRLCSWDEMALDPGWQGPGVEDYWEMLVRHLETERSDQ